MNMLYLLDNHDDDDDINERQRPYDQRYAESVDALNMRRHHGAHAKVEGNLDRS